MIRLPPRNIASVALASIALTLANTSVAQTQPGEVPLRIHGDRPGLSYQLLDVNNKSKVVKECKGDCTVHLPRGRYEFRVVNLWLDDYTTIDLRGAAQLNVDDGSMTGRIGGLFFGVVGTVGVLALTPFAVMATLWPSNSDHPYRLSTELWEATGLSLAAATAGWIWMGTSGTTVTGSPQRKEGARTSPSWPMVGVAPSPHGMGVVMGGVF